MYKTHQALLIILVFGISFHGLAEQRQLAITNTQVEDGDTVKVAIDGEIKRIQLNGIDAPEDIDNPKFQADLSRTQLEREQLLQLGKTATQYLSVLLKTNPPNTLKYDAEKKDRYGRNPGDIIDSEGQSIAQLMVENGYAITSPHSTQLESTEKLKGLQQQAIDKGRGLWGHYPKASRRWAGMNKP